MASRGLQITLVAQIFGACGGRVGREVGRLVGDPYVLGIHFNFRLVTARQPWLVGEVTRDVLVSSVDHRLLLFIFLGRENRLWATHGDMGTGLVGFYFFCIIVIIIIITTGAYRWVCLSKRASCFSCLWVISHHAHSLEFHSKARTQETVVVLGVFTFFLSSVPGSRGLFRIALFDRYPPATSSERATLFSKLL